MGAQERVRRKPQARVRAAVNENGKKLFSAYQGKPHGSRVRVAQFIKDAVAIAMEEIGHPKIKWHRIPTKKVDADGNTVFEFKIKSIEKGDGGLVGYCTWLGLHHPEIFKSLITRAMPLQFIQTKTSDQDAEVIDYPTTEQARAALRDAGLPNEPLYLTARELLRRREQQLLLEMADRSED